MTDHKREKKKTHGELLKKWDNSLDNTVQVFNEIFIDSTLDCALDSQVTIGNVVRNGHGICREVFINGIKTEHWFCQAPDDRWKNNGQKMKGVHWGNEYFETVTDLAWHLELINDTIYNCLRHGKKLRGKELKREE